jgi:hypothetical protein
VDAGEVEDGVVGHDPEEENDQDGLHLLRHRDPDLEPDPRDHAHRDEVGEPGRDEREQRPPGDTSARYDRDGVSSRSPRSARVLDLLELRDPGRPGAGDADERSCSCSA